MARPNYNYAKRQRELAKKAKKEAKRQRKEAAREEKRGTPPGPGGPAAS